MERAHINSWINALDLCFVLTPKYSDQRKRNAAMIVGMYCSSSSISILLIHYFGTDQALRIRVLQEGHSMNTEEGVVKTGLGFG